MPSLMVCLVGLLVSVHASPVSPPVVSGQVRLSDGSPVAGAQVVLFDVADLRRGAVGQATTDEAGQFALPLAAGGALVLPQGFALGQNYPNPFNPSTIIPYQLAATSPVRLEVFNVLGQRVATLVDDEQGAGAYVARWDGTDAAGGAAASGLYFYRLTVGGAHQTGKMVLVDGQAGVPLGGARVEAVPLAAGSTVAYGLVVSGEGLVAYVDSDFGGAAGSGPVAIAVEARPNVRMKVVPTLEGMLGDVNADGRVDLDDGLLVAMYGVDPALSLPNHGELALGDVNCDGRVELEDAGLIASYVAHPSDPAVSSLRIGQHGGYSLDPVTEMVWGSILGTKKKDATVARILDEVPVLLSGVMPIDGQDRLYLGIGRDWWAKHGGKQLYEALKERFPVTPIHVEPTIGVVPLSGPRRARAPSGPVRTLAPVRLTGPPLSFAESPRTALKGQAKKQHVVGSITVPDSVMVGTVSVGVDLTHPFRSDLKIDLVAPSGVATTLYDGIRGGINPEDNILERLPVTDALQGQAAQGTWQLRVGDYEQEDTGTLHSWDLTITPASATQETETPAHLFRETFQEGLGSWQTTQWEARSLDSDATVPGEGAGNIVAQTQGCPLCFMTLTEPVDLSAHDSVTLSFYRWMDAGMGDGEFLGIDIGNNGSYRRLKNWNKQDADGGWHLETFTLSKEQISDSFTVRFFATTKNAFTTIAVDNVMISAVPGSVVVEPIPGEETTEPETEEEPETTPQPDLTITITAVSPTSVQSGDTVTLRVRVKNEGTTPASQESVFIYRHSSETTNPKSGGVQVRRTSTGKILAPNASVRGTFRSPAPTVSATKQYYYYACVDIADDEQDTDDNCSPTPAEVTVQSTVPEPETEEEPAAQPDLTITITAVSPASVQSGDTVALQVRVQNKGTAPASQEAVYIYQHSSETANPKTGGVRIRTTSTGKILAPNASVRGTFRSPAPTVSATKQYYYYACVDTADDEHNTDDNCSATPAEVTVRSTVTEPETPDETEEEPEEPTGHPDLSVTNATASPASLQSSYIITVQAKITNTGTAPAETETVRIYRHVRKTNNPKTGGTRERGTAATGTLLTGNAVTVTSTHTAPTVSETKRYYYYVCVDPLTDEQNTDDNCSRTPAEVVVRVKPEDTGPPYENCLFPPERSTPMGGDVMSVQDFDYDFGITGCGTITLGGLETVTGEQGFVVSAHVIAGAFYPRSFTRIDAFVGHSRYKHSHKIKYFLGKVFKIPGFRTEGEKKVLNVDAAFVAYPHPKTPGCSLTWSGDEEEFCLDPGHSDYIERLVPLTVRGKNGKTHKVIGSKEPTVGLDIQVIGSVSGIPTNGTVSKGRILYNKGNHYEYSYHSFIDKTPMPGDSGGPVYTVPDSAGTVHILGLIFGVYSIRDSDKREIGLGLVFDSWEDITKELGLKPIGR